jgi:hypothetical protein
MVDKGSTSLGARDRKVYKLILTCRHPDKNNNSEESTHMMQQINAAKGRLDSKGRRHQNDYDSDYEEDSDYYDEDEDDYYDEDEDFDPFGDFMDFAAFVRM